ncbi:MAG: T9SS type A sorting domain-containing protein [Ignavibacteria bacterium]|nr:T9SS type A sorting domain-containing protein [Ignavibacteria bacterium]
MKKLSIILIIALNGFIFLETFSQPQKAIHPMTGQGARGISYGNLYWDNPSDISYNEVYLSSDSSLVYNLDPSVKVQSGFPATVFDSVSIAELLSPGKKYYWRVVEFDSTGNNPGDVWFFRSYALNGYIEEYFPNLNDWEVLGPNGINNWKISNTSFAGTQPPELKFDNIPASNGISRIIHKTVLATDVYSGIRFNYYFDGASGSTIGCAYTNDDGITWTKLWETSPSGNISGMANFPLPNETYLQIGFYFEGNTNNLNGWYIDDVRLMLPLGGPLPPKRVKAKADTSALRVNLSWDAGSSPSPCNYRIERKEGIPISTNNYSLLTDVPFNTLSYLDTSIQLKKNYTYRIQIIYGPPGMGSNWSNEATAYVPSVVPVELKNFSAGIKNNNVRLNWMTASETNNKGFEVERSIKNSNLKIKNFETIGFVNGNGTSTQLNTYSFNDENVSAGKYIYRLKQIDFDGSFEYSTEIEVEIALPVEFALYQNYPNPFNPTTIIKYSIPSLALWERVSEGRVRVFLKVYDILGNEVTTLVNEEKQPGEYEVEFDGSKLSSGVYFYQLKTGSFIQTNKMILMR